MTKERRFDLVAFDMDGVLVDYPSSWTWIHNHFGVTNETSLEEYIRGEIDDTEFMRRDIALWKACKKDLSKKDIESILTPLPLLKGIDETVRALKNAGMRTVIVSGGIDVIAERIKRIFGFDDYIANGLEFDEKGCLTGEGILRVELTNKRRALDSFLHRWGISRNRVVSIGNSFVDVSMFEDCGLSIAFNPIDEVVVKNADVIVRSNDLRAVLPIILEEPSQSPLYPYSPINGTKTQPPRFI
ncbi:MAG: HAD-IB family phosphatase [Methanomassiliicoccales archaeon]|jgi:phosphoserine phosphatase|nr:HAD-IB family phosphatase [Methanomassiliicoccales archaeon]